MKLFKLAPLILVLVVGGCSSMRSNESPNVAKEPASPTYSGMGTLAIAPVIFTKGLQVRQAVRKECQLLTKLPSFIQSYSQDQYATINLSAKKRAAHYLKVEIIDVPQFKKSGWNGRRSSIYGGGSGQWVAVKGTLIRKGKKTVSFKASRISSGGFMGGYKGTCALLGRCTKALGKDIAAWLKNPINGAELGDM